MSELCISKCHFSSLVISDFILLCSFILSHPLYFSYFIFFSPYLLKLFSFLSPLFLTTFLLSLAFLAGFESSQTLLTSILQSLQFKKDHCPNEEDDLGIYEIVFGPPSMAAVTQEEDPSQILDQIQTLQKDRILVPNPLPGSEIEGPIVVAKAEDFEESRVSLSSKSEIPCAVVMEEKRLENFLKILDEFERLTSNAEEKKKKQEPPPRGGAKSNKVVEKQKSLFMNAGSEAADRNNNYENQTIDPTKLESSAMAKSQSQRIIITAAADDREDLSSYGSMRREREWKRTLACKLFEERHNAGAVGGGGGGEAMDSLWEAYEVDSEKLNKRRGEKAKKKEEREWEEEDEVGGAAQLCCLQALKLSAGKMNLGVGKPNLVKISMAIKGIGWLHNLTKNSKKVHNNGDHRY